MKTTLEIPDTLLLRAKTKAAERRISLRQFVIEALAEKINAESTYGPKLWMQMFGGLKHLRKETARIQRLIDDEFERIEPVRP
jgi:hypothetical protein